MAAAQLTQVPQKILDVATHLFAKQGFEGTSLQAIAEGVGIRKPSLLYHFPSKAALHQAVLENLLSHWNSVLPRVLVAATSSHGQFDGVVQAMISFFSSDPDRARVLVREVMDHPKEMKRLIKKHVQPWVEVVCNYIRKGQQQGRLHLDIDPEAYVFHIITLLTATIATGAQSSGLSQKRNNQELFRIAKASLFIGSVRTE